MADIEYRFGTGQGDPHVHHTEATVDVNGDGVADGTCTFRVAICLNQTDPALGACTPGTTDGVHVTLGRTPEHVANADALLGALEALGGTRGGRRLDDVTFSPAVTGSQCTAFSELTNDLSSFVR